MSDKILNILSKYRIVRSVVRFMEKNHLTKRSSDDLFYHTRPIFKSMEPDSVLASFHPQHRLHVRPKNFLRRWLFDYSRLDMPAVIPLTRNLEVRNKFRNITDSQVRNKIESMQVAPTNNHGFSAVTRNAASQLLTGTKWPDGFNTFSLSGSRIEQDNCDYGYRGLHQATDFAQEQRREIGLFSAPEISGHSHSYRVLIVSTDTTNHLPFEDKNAILGNGIPIVSYSPTAISERAGCKNRTTTWDGNKLITKVNGGGDYTDIMSNSNTDVEVVDCPDGDIMLVYLDTFRDPIDVTHSYICETPFAKLARYTREFDMFKDTPRPQPLTPYTVTNADGCSFTCLPFRHNDLIQITDNVARVTHYFGRNELLALHSMEPSVKAKMRLQRTAPEVAGIVHNHQLRYETLQRIGFSKLLTICKNGPEINMAAPTMKNRFEHSNRLVFSAAFLDEKAFKAAMDTCTDDEKKKIVAVLSKYDFTQVDASKYFEPPPGFDRSSSFATLDI